MKELRSSGNQHLKSWSSDELKSSNELVTEITAVINAVFGQIKNGVPERELISAHNEIWKLTQKPIYSSIKHLHISAEYFSFPDKEMAEIASGYFGFALKTCTNFGQYIFHGLDFQDRNNDGFFFEFGNQSHAKSVILDACKVDAESLKQISLLLTEAHSSTIKSVRFNNMDVSAALEAMPANQSAQIRQLIAEGSIVLENCDLKAEDITLDRRAESPHI